MVKTDSTLRAQSLAVGAAKRMQGQADPELLPRWFRDVHRAIWGDRIDLLLNSLSTGKEVLFCDLKVKWVRKGLQAPSTGQVDPRLQVTLRIKAIVDPGELDFSLEKVDLQVFIQCPRPFLYVDGCARAQRRCHQVRKMIFHYLAMAEDLPLNIAV